MESSLCWAVTVAISCIHVERPWYISISLTRSFSLCFSLHPSICTLIKKCCHPRWGNQHWSIHPYQSFLAHSFSFSLSHESHYHLSTHQKSPIVLHMKWISFYSSYKAFIWLQETWNMVHKSHWPLLWYLVCFFHIGLKKHEGEQMMTEFSVELSL